MEAKFIYKDQQSRHEFIRATIRKHIKTQSVVVIDEELGEGATDSWIRDEFGADKTAMITSFNSIYNYKQMITL